MKLTRTFTLLIVPIVLTACQSNSVNKLIRDLPSPDGRFHVEVLQCRANDVMFGGATQVQVSVLKKGETEKCRSFIYALAQFDVRTIDFGAKDNALHIEWLSDTELSVWHRSFATSQGKNYIGPDVQHSQANSPIKVIFSPLATQIGMPSQIKK
ncbi:MULTISPECIES: hypothetical protein [unclassified Acinetobacter]|uniref:hypothetical protein n=1 Tax=unclassified Acinetobacter TaxID=196816 RepID=UPI003AF4AEB6